jgi:hypothetical protein
MKACVARKRDRWYAVVYEGLDPVTGRERPAGIRPGLGSSSMVNWGPTRPAPSFSDRCRTTRVAATDRTVLGTGGGARPLRGP